MKRLAVLSLLAPLAVLGTAGPARGAELCQGQVPTIVGTPGETVTGTAGDDVIATEGADSVDAGDGNDRICVTNHGSSPDASTNVFVRAGAGDDVVDTTADPDFYVSALLGLGVDAFHGGAGDDRVDARDLDDTGETISTGGGRDTVITGRTGRPMNDVVDLGGGMDYLGLRGVPGTGSLVAGAGRDVAHLFDKSRAEWRIDNRKHQLTVGATMPLVGVENFDLSHLRWRSLTFVGGPSQEGLDLSKHDRPPPDGSVLVDMGGADDILVVGPARLSGPYHGGAGADRLVIEGDERPTLAGGRIRVDLLAGLVRIGTGDEVKATSWTDLEVSTFDRNLVRAGPGAQHVVVHGCRATVYAGPGDDDVRLVPPDTGCAGAVSSRALTAYGEGGDDLLAGWTGDDRLLGGPGMDTARGSAGRDVCSAEVRIGCER